jgi:hypothetical protein
MNHHITTLDWAKTARNEKFSSIQGNNSYIQPVNKSGSEIAFLGPFLDLDGLV